MALDYASLAQKAADNLEKTFWFGILEDMERSLELLRFKLGAEDPIVMARTNTAKAGLRNLEPIISDDRLKLTPAFPPAQIWDFCAFKGKLRRSQTR